MIISYFVLLFITGDYIALTIYRLPVYRMTIDEVKSWIFQYVFGYYNRMRVTTVNPGGWPPSVYREMYMKTVAAA